MYASLPIMLLVKDIYCTVKRNTKYETQLFLQNFWFRENICLFENFREKYIHNIVFVLYRTKTVIFLRMFKEKIT